MDDEGSPAQFHVQLALGLRRTPPEDACRPQTVSGGQDIDVCGSGPVGDPGDRSRTDGCRPDGRLQRKLENWQRSTAGGGHRRGRILAASAGLRAEQPAFLTLWERLWERLRRCSRNYLHSQPLSVTDANTPP